MIDAHFHIWQLARGDYGWLTAAAGPIYRDVSIQDWRQVSRHCGVTGGILIQAAPTEDETRFLLQQARDAPDVLGVVGWVDMLCADAAHRIRRLAADSKLKGLRPMLQDLKDPQWILQPALRGALQAMLDCELTLDALVRPEHIAHILELARRYPALRIVIDHGAKPDIARGQWHDWSQGMQALAWEPQVYCKLSGLWTQAAPGTSVTDLAPYVRLLLAAFGARKTLWGSDWPVLELAGSYPEWQKAARDQVNSQDFDAVFSSAAKQAYRLD